MRAGGRERESEGERKRLDRLVEGTSILLDMVRGT